MYKFGEVICKLVQNAPKEPLGDEGYAFVAKRRKKYYINSIINMSFSFCKRSVHRLFCTINGAFRTFGKVFI